jgi:hypothetical protein
VAAAEEVAAVVEVSAGLERASDWVSALASGLVSGSGTDPVTDSSGSDQDWDSDPERGRDSDLDSAPDLSATSRLLA